MAETLAALAAVMAVLWWTTNRPLANMPSPLVAKAPAPVARPDFPPPEPVESRSDPAPVAAIQAIEQPPVAMATEPEPALWETQIEQALQSPGGGEAAARALIQMLPALPRPGQLDAANHITGLLDDEHYAGVLPILRNPGMPVEVLAVLYTDLASRGERLKLPTLLDLAAVTAHPMAEQARHDLESRLNRDYGADWNQWKVAVEQYLNANPAPAAP